MVTTKRSMGDWIRTSDLPTKSAFSTPRGPISAPLTLASLSVARSIAYS